MRVPSSAIIQRRERTRDTPSTRSETRLEFAASDTTVLSESPSGVPPTGKTESSSIPPPAVTVTSRFISSIEILPLSPSDW